MKTMKKLKMIFKCHYLSTVLVMELNGACLRSSYIGFCIPNGKISKESYDSIEAFSFSWIGRLCCRRNK